MKDMRTTKIMLAVCMVALMLAVAVVPAIQGPTDADETVNHRFSDSYMYVITLDGTSTEKINDVQVSVNGSALTSHKSYDETTDNRGVEYIDDFWQFDSDTGLGPFNSFYAAVNLTSGTEKIGNEDKIASGAGQIAFVLNPNNLKRTMGGTDLTSYLGQFNIMLIIPTVYWKADGTKLYISNSSSYTVSGQSAITGMVAYAHIANPLNDGGKTHATDGKTPYPYIGIGVYEASVADGKLYSQSGKTPKVSTNHDTFVGYAQTQTTASAASGSAYQQWNFYQWTLYKIMSYSVMGTKNSQQMIGNGYVSASGSQTTGASDASGAYYGTSENSTTVSKLFIENSWGSVYEFVGDTCFSEKALYTGNTLGGATIGTSSHSGKQTTNGVTLQERNWISGTSKASATWDLPTAGTQTSNATSMDVPGEYIYSNPGWCSISVGGYWSNTSEAGVARADAGCSLYYSNSNVGARLAYVMSADAADGLADALKIQSRWTVDPAGVPGLVYSGTDQALATAGTVNGGTPKYSLDNTVWSTSVPSATVAGTYTVYYKIEANADYRGLDAQSFTVTISPKPVTITGVTIADHVFDNTASATISGGGSVSGVAAEDTVTVNTSSATAEFIQTTVGGAIGVTLSGFALSGADKDNYVLSAQPTATGNITPRALSVSVDADKVYDRTVFAYTVRTADATGLAAGDAITAGAIATTAYNAKDYTVQTTDWIVTTALATTYGISNYNVTWTVSLEIAKKQLSGLIWSTPADLVYTKTAKNPTCSAGAEQGVVSGDTVNVTSSVTVADSNVNVGTFTFTATGLSDSNYSLPANCVSPTYTITPKAVSITGISVEDKVYDGSTAATASGGTVDGKIGNDDVSVFAGTASFADANAGSGKAVTFAGYKLAGTKASNYSLPAQPALTTASISARPISVSWAYPANLTYSGTAKVCTPSITNIVGGDTVAPTPVLSAGKDAVNVTAEGFTYEVTGLTGSSASNYTLANATGLTSDTKLITKAQFTVAPKENLEISKTYDGTQTVTKVFSLSDFVISSLQNGEQLASVSITALYDGAMPREHDVEITQMTFAAEDMTPSTSYVASNYDIIVNGNEVWGAVGVRFIIPASEYVVIIPAGGSVDTFTISYVLAGTIDGSTVPVDGTHVQVIAPTAVVEGDTADISVIKKVNAISVSVTATNSSVSQMGDGVWMLYGISDDVVVTVTVSPATDFGIMDVCVTAVVGNNEGAKILIRSVNDGLYQGTVDLKGVYSKMMGGIRYYGEIQDTVCADKTVDLGDSEYYQNFMLSSDKKVYYVYAVYTYNDGTGQKVWESAGLLAPALVITVPEGD